MDEGLSDLVQRKIEEDSTLSARMMTDSLGMFRDMFRG
jgi:hypothetical protein